MPRHSDKIVRQDIINAGKLIIEFIEGFDKSTFVKDQKNRSDVLYQLTVIARRRPSIEAIPSFSEEIASQKTLAMTYFNCGLLVPFVDKLVQSPTNL